MRDLVSVGRASRDQVEVHSFHWTVSILVPALAIFLQAFVPAKLRVFEFLDLPLLITIYFAVSRRNPISGLLLGSAIGLVQDSLTHQMIGLYGIAKTLVGYAASSIGAKIDVDNPGSRFIMTFVLYLGHQGAYFGVARGLARQVVDWRWGHELGVAVVNAFVAVALFAILDRLRQRG